MEMLGRASNVSGGAIELAIITSALDTPKLSAYGDIDLAFAHLCLKNPDYARYFAERSKQGKCVILDNGIMELGHSVTESTLVEVINLIRPAFVTPPEVLGDGLETLRLTESFLSRADSMGLSPETKFLGVVHGSQWSDWLSFYRVLHDGFERIERIGIPYDLPFEVPGVEYGGCTNRWERYMRNRIQIVRLLQQEGLDRKQVHLLGCVDAIELRVQAQYPFIVSNDSSTVFVTSLRGEVYNLRSGIRCQKHKIDMTTCLPNKHIDLFHRNLGVVREFAKRPTNDHR